MQPAHKRAGFGRLGHIARRKLQNDNDLRVIVQGANSQTGIGKTTLAIQLCRYIDQNEWSADKKAFIDVDEYIEAHLEYEKGSCLLLDEIEAGADNRRAMSDENVELSQAWATMRARNIATVATLPSISMLDKRMMELADYWVLVRERGVAQPYEIVVNDFAPHRAPQRKPLPGKEHITFPDLPNNDPDKKYLDEIKDDMLRSTGSGKVKESECRKRVKDAKHQTKQDTRNELLVDIYDNLDVTYADIAELPSVGVSRQRVAQIIRDA